jgi:hypothetical protein
MGVGAATVLAGGAAIFIMHQQGILSSTLTNLQQRLESAATKRQGTLPNSVAHCNCSSILYSTCVGFSSKPPARIISAWQTHASLMREAHFFFLHSNMCYKQQFCSSVQLLGAHRGLGCVVSIQASIKTMRSCCAEDASDVDSDDDDITTLGVIV